MKFVATVVVSSSSPALGEMRIELPPLLARQVLSQLSYTPYEQGIRIKIFFSTFEVYTTFRIAPSKLNNDLQVLTLIDYRI